MWQICIRSFVAKQTMWWLHAFGCAFFRLLKIFLYIYRYIVYISRYLPNKVHISLIPFKINIAQGCSQHPSNIKCHFQCIWDQPCLNYIFLSTQRNRKSFWKEKEAATTNPTLLSQPPPLLPRQRWQQMSAIGGAAASNDPNPTALHCCHTTLHCCSAPLLCSRSLLLHLTTLLFNVWETLGRPSAQHWALGMYYYILEIDSGVGKVNFYTSSQSVLRDSSSTLFQP